MKQRNVITGVLNSVLLVAAMVAWLQQVADGVNILEVASLLAVVAFCLMWVHYAADIVAPRQHTKHGVQYIASRVFVLAAIIAHPLLINVYLVTNGYGLPPESYEKLVGSMLPVLLGWLALVAFVMFELRGRLVRYKRHIFHANVIAMFLILIHGFSIGMVIMRGWFVWVWWFLLVTFTYIALRNYATYYKDATRRNIAISIVLLLAGVSVFAGWSNTQERLPQRSIAPTTSDAQVQSANSDTGTVGNTVTHDELSLHNGKNGAACWVAIDGTVYDASGSPEWVNGEHKPSRGQAKCGQDLTDIISQSPHGRSVLGDLRVIGKLAN